MNERTPLGQPGNMQPDTQVGRDPTFSLQIDAPDNPDGSRPAVSKDGEQGMSVEIDKERASVHREDESAGDDLTDEERAALGDEEGGDKEDSDTAKDALPDYDATKPDVVQKYETTFIKDGTFNVEALSRDWYAHATQDGGFTDGHLSEGTYKFLESKGLSRETIKLVEQGEVAKRTLMANQVFDAAGGQENYTSAIDWARKGGYSKQQREQFNKALNGDADEREAAVRLLITRFGKANPGAVKTTGDAKPARGVSPKKTVSDGGNGGGGGSSTQGYANYEEYQKDLRAARNSNDTVALNKTRARLKASAWYNKK